MRHPALSRLLRIEQQLELGRQKVLGYPVWGIERFPWYERSVLRELLAEGGAPSVSQGANSGSSERLASRWFRIEQSLRDLVVRRDSEQRDVWVLSSSQYRRRDASGASRCMFTLDLERQLGDRLLFLERNRSSMISEGRRDLVTIDGVTELIAELADKLAYLLTPLVPREARRAFSGVRPRTLAKTAISGALLEAATEVLISRRRPSAVFVLCSYTRFVPVQRALKRHGIPLIELQHGIIHQNHAGYSFAGDQAPDYAPDHMLVFGKAFGRALERCSPYWKGRWSVSGHRWLNEAATRFAPNPGASDAPLVVFSQPVVTVREQLKRVLPELRAKVDARRPIILKPHPRETDAASFYASVLSSGVQLAKANDDCYELLSSCHASICVHSTVAFEALAFGCHSVVLRSPSWPPEIAHAVNDGILLAADDAEGAARIVASPLPRASRSELRRALFAAGDAAVDVAALIRDVGCRARARDSFSGPSRADEAVQARKFVPPVFLGDFVPVPFGPSAPERDTHELSNS